VAGSRQVWKARYLFWKPLVRSEIARESSARYSAFSTIASSIPSGSVAAGGGDGIGTPR